jgi:two-component system sensor histidine kinase MtrB
MTTTPTGTPAAGHRLGLRWRVSVVFAGLALLVSAGVAIFSYELTRTYLLDRRVTGAQREAFANARAVRDALRVNPEDVRGALAQAQTGSGSVVVRSGSGWFGTSVGVGRNEVPPSLRHLVAGGSAGTQFTTLASEPTIAVGLPLPAVKAAYFELDTTRDLDQTLVLLAQALAVAAGVVTLVGAVLGWYVAGRVLRPVRRMAATAAGIGEGALGERLDAEGDSDLEPLVDSFNAMVAALRTRIERETRFASDVSHELRTPLASMGSALSVARRHRGTDTPEATDAALDVLGQELDRFTVLVQDLLEISRLEAGVESAHRTNEAPAQLVHEVLVSTHRNHVRVEVDPSAPGLVDLDKRRIGQVLANLLNNADAHGGGATAVVVAGTETLLLLAVDDAGPGIPADERERMFERFARGSWSDATPGTGLGLSLAVEHLRLHDGRVWVDDSPDGGARFVVEVPRWSM